MKKSFKFEQAIDAMMNYDKKIRGEDWGQDEFIFFDRSKRAIIDQSGDSVHGIDIIENMESEFFIVGDCFDEFWGRLKNENN